MGRPDSLVGDGLTSDESRGTVDTMTNLLEAKAKVVPCDSGWRATLIGGSTKVFSELSDAHTWATRMVHLFRVYWSAPGRRQTLEKWSS